jgi:hypothetical protein
MFLNRAIAYAVIAWLLMRKTTQVFHFLAYGAIGWSSPGFDGCANSLSVLPSLITNMFHETKLQKVSQCAGSGSVCGIPG